jgi:hypothetical protein
VPADGISTAGANNGSTAGANNGNFGTSPLFCRPLGKIVVHVIWGLRRQSAMAEEFKPITFDVFPFDLESAAASKNAHKHTSYAE